MSRWSWYDAYGEDGKIERIEFGGWSLQRGEHVAKFSGVEPDYLCSIRATDELHAYKQATKWLEEQGKGHE